MAAPKFNIGDAVWHATFAPTTSRYTCPDCGGTGFFTARLFDNTEHTVACPGCERGYEGSVGYLTVYDRSPFARETTIAGVDLSEGGFEYRTADSYSVAETDLFLDRPSALERAREMAAQASQDEIARIQHKEKDTRSWGWHVHYYRKQIRDAESAIERAKAHLSVAAKKAKEAVEP